MLAEGRALVQEVVNTVWLATVSTIAVRFFADLMAMVFEEGGTREKAHVGAAVFVAADKTVEVGGSQCWGDSLFELFDIVVVCEIGLAFRERFPAVLGS